MYPKQVQKSEISRAKYKIGSAGRWNLQCKTVKLKMIHSKVVSHDKNKIEAEFGDSNSVLIESLKDSAQKKQRKKNAKLRTTN